MRKDDRLSLVEGQLYSDTNLRIEDLHLADAGTLYKLYSDTNLRIEDLHLADAGIHCILYSCTLIPTLE